MRLKNKRTGEIGELQVTEKHCAVAVGNGTANCGVEIYSSLARLYEDWEDYEEPKGFWSISGDATIEHYDRLSENDHCKEIGNYFETKEEAEKAVEKLKAFKRLRDKGFKFILEDSYVEQTKDTGESKMFIACIMNDYHDFVFGDNADLALLFGVEE
jgi:hypothetical protein